MEGRTKALIFSYASGIIITAIIVAVLWLVLVGMRQFSASTTPLTVSRPEIGLLCVTANSNDGVAISCIKEAP